MKSTLDPDGRLMIPKQLQDEAGLRPGMELKVTCHDGRIEVEPADGYVSIEEREGLLVGVPQTPSRRISSEEIETLIDAAHREPASSQFDD